MHPFPGYPAFLDRAAAEIGRPEAAGPARRITTLSAMANLCAQAAVAEDAAVPGILSKADEFRDQLRVALRAADLMLIELRAGRGLVPPPSPGRPPKSVPGPARRGVAPHTLP